MKRFIGGSILILLTVVLVLISTPVLAANPGKLVVNGKQVACPVAPLSVNGCVMVPASALAQALGASYKYDSNTGTITITGKPVTIVAPAKQAPAPVKPAPASTTPPTPTTTQGQKVFNKAGTYGPASGTQTVTSNSSVTVPGVTLQNTVFSGNLNISSASDTGTVTFNNVTVKGKLTISGVGPSGVTFNNCTLTALDINDSTNTITVKASGNTTVANTSLYSGATLQESLLTGSGFTNMTVSPSSIAGTILTGSFDVVTVKGIQPMLLVSPVSVVTRMDVNAPATISGTGTIQNAYVNAAGTTFETRPTNLVLAPGIEATIGGTKQTSTGSSSSSSSSTSSTSSERSIAWSASTFEPSNNGTCSTSITATLSNDTFAAGPFSSGSQFNCFNVPSGFTVNIARTSDTVATVTLSGTASARSTVNDLRIIFDNTAFTHGQASLVQNYSKSDFTIRFPQRSLSWSKSSLYMDGSSISFNVDISGDTFVTGSFVKDTHFTSTFPADLTLNVTRDSDTRLIFTFTRNAGSGSAANVGITFKDAAFTGGSASSVSDYTKTNFAIMY
ncbi:MAG: stalk domain-containing protein [Acidobacteriota bacterium]